MTAESCPPMETDEQKIYIRGPRTSKTDFLWTLAIDREFRLSQMTTAEREEYEELERQDQQRLEASRLAQQQLLQRTWQILQERLHILDVLDTVNCSKDQKLIEWKKE